MMLDLDVGFTASPMLIVNATMHSHSKRVNQADIYVQVPHLTVADYKLYFSYC